MFLILAVEGGEPLRELLILSVVLTAVAVAIYISFA
jgi:hypothetical protein